MFAIGGTVRHKTSQLLWTIAAQSRLALIGSTACGSKRRRA